MPRTNVAGFLLVVVEILRLEATILVSNQSIRFHMGRIEFDLDLHVLGNLEDVTGQVLQEDLAGLRFGIDIGIAALSLVGEGFQHVVLVVTHAKPKDGQGDAIFRLLIGNISEVPAVGLADIEITIGAEDDAVIAVLDEVVAGHLVGQLDAGSGIGRSTGTEIFQGMGNGGVVIGRGRRQDEARGSGIDDNRHPVPAIEAVHQQVHGLFDQRKLVGVIH